MVLERYLTGSSHHLSADNREEDITTCTVRPFDPVLQTILSRTQKMKFSKFPKNVCAIEHSILAL